MPTGRVFVAVLEANPRCKLGCYGTGTVKHTKTVRLTKVSKDSICACAFVQYMEEDFELVLQHMAELAGRKVSSKAGIVSLDEARQELAEK